jgi:ATP-dependent DNA helicase RecQ
MANFASAPVCRRKQLLEYFDEPHGGNCGSCDVCTGRAKEIEMSTEARMLLSAVLRTGERFGAAHVVDVVYGAKTEKIRRFDHDRLPTWGVGKHRPKTFWRELAGNLIAGGHLVSDPDRYGALGITPTGREVLFGRLPFRSSLRSGPGRAAMEPAEAAGRPAEAAGKPRTSSWFKDASVDLGLFERLRLVRLDIAAEKNVPPYVVFSDKTLREMSRLIPRSPAELLEVPGVGEHKLEAYGDIFLREIRQFEKIEKAPQSNDQSKD